MPLADRLIGDPVRGATADTREAFEDVNDMSEEAQKARQALQESLDLRDQGHSDD